jgi:hypothetical protein
MFDQHRGCYARANDAHFVCLSEYVNVMMNCAGGLCSISRESAPLNICETWSLVECLADFSDREGIDERSKDGRHAGRIYHNVAAILQRFPVISVCQHR